MSNEQEIPPVSRETQDCIDDLGAALESMVDITTAISKKAWETEAPTSAAELVELDEIILCARNVLDATSKFRSHKSPSPKEAADVE